MNPYRKLETESDSISVYFVSFEAGQANEGQTNKIRLRKEYNFPIHNIRLSPIRLSSRTRERNTI